MSFTENEADPNQPRWLEWVERNAQPKVLNFPRPCRVLTRFQKRGPMTRKDWVRFYHWAAKNALPRPPYIPKPPPEVPCDPKKKCRKKVKRKPLEKIMAHVEKLTNPKWQRDKYEFPPKPDYPYSPKIHRKEPAKHDPGRPFQPIKVPSCFQHWELEEEFWYTVRFPIRGPALRYQISPNIRRLAEPPEWPFPVERLHCKLPPRPVEYVAPRLKMSYKQWLAHLRRLEYLSKPTQRPEFDAFYADDY